MNSPRAVIIERPIDSDHEKWSPTPLRREVSPEVGGGHAWRALMALESNIVGGKKIQLKALSAQSRAE